MLSSTAAAAHLPNTAPFHGGRQRRLLENTRSPRSHAPWSPLPPAWKLCSTPAASLPWSSVQGHAQPKVLCMAKGGKKGGGSQKKGGSLIPKSGKEAGDKESPPPPVVPYAQAEVIMHSLDIIDSYFRAVGKPIFAEPVEVVNAAKTLWDADFVVMSHGTEEDPIFNYGNAKALALFGTSWAEFTSMPSRKSCSEETQSVRQELLASAQGGPKDLKGIVRVTTQGRPFEMDEGVLWTLVASDGENFGQAAVLRQWHFLDEEGKEEGESTKAQEGETSEMAAKALQPAAPAEIST